MLVSGSSGRGELKLSTPSALEAGIKVIAAKDRVAIVHEKDDITRPESQISDRTLSEVVGYRRDENVVERFNSGSNRLLKRS